MAENDRIELNIQLPENALEQLSHLAEQLQGLLETALGGAAQTRRLEEGENLRFDPQRFRALGAEGASYEESSLPEGAAAAPVLSRLPDTEGYVQAPLADLPEPVLAQAAPELAHEVLSAGREPAKKLGVPRGAYREISSPAQDPASSVKEISRESLFSEASPLTAEDVSQAFRLDDRRYDSGFPLY